MRFRRGRASEPPRSASAARVRGEPSRHGYARYVHALRLLGSIAGYSDSFVLIDLIFGVAFAFLGFRVSERYKRTHGVTPWRWPSAVWAILFFVSLILGVVLYLIARSTTRPKPGPTGWTGGQPGWSADPSGIGGPSPGGWNPTPPSGWGPGAQPGGGAPAPGGSGTGAPMPGHQGSPPPGGWDAPPPPGTGFPSFELPGSPQS